jgi:predicted alpha/beta superfamily hydrolase
MANLRAALQRAFRRENRRVAPRPGRLEPFPFTRAVTVYLPAGYDEREQQRYPVLYMQDGQNLFDPNRAFIPGQHWRLKEAADEAIFARKARPIIIVGIDNAGAARIDEYTPTRDEKRNAGGHADDYGRLLLDTLKPAIDAHYRTLSDRSGTAIGGSSLGGLLALHLALRCSDRIGAAAVMSPSVWWDDRVLVREVDAFAGERPRVWLDIGGREGMEALRDARLLRDRMLAKGWRMGNPARPEDRQAGLPDLHYLEDRRADHSERAWAARAGRVLEFLFPAA